MGAGPLRGQVPLTALGPEDVLSAVAPILIDAARQGLKKVVLDGKTFAPFGMLPHAVEPVKVAAFRPKAGSKRVPAKVDLRNYMTTVEDQSQTNSCCANAVCGAYEYMGKRDAMEKGGSVFVDDISRLFIYYVGRKRDQQLFREDTSLAPRDEGMSLGGALSALEMKGACLEKNWPFNISKVNDTPSNACFREAIRYKIAESRKVPVDLSSMRQCLAEGHPIVFGLKQTAQFFKPSPGGGIVTPDVDDPQSAEHGLHAMLIVGYNDRQEVFIVRNSWGTSWGDKGYGYVPYDYICNDDFNFLGQYAIIGLSQYDFSRNVDDGQDYQIGDADDDQPELEEIEDDPQDDVEDEFDPEDEFNPEKEARRVFETYDINNDGALAGHELFMCFMGNGVPMTMKQFQKISRDHRLDQGEKMDFDQEVVGSKFELPASYDWTRLDEYASYLHEQDALRQQLGVKALQRKMRMDLDQQVAEKSKRKTDAVEEDRRYFENSLMEMERWKEQEQLRQDEKQQRIVKEKLDRDAQLEYERKLKDEELQKKKDEEASLVEKIVNEMELEQRRYEKKKEQTKRAMRKVFEENMEDQRRRNIAKKEATEKEAETMKEYNRLLDEQEGQRAMELAARMERQSELMKKLQENVDSVKKGAGDNDAQRAALQAEEQDRHYFEAESVKQNRLQQMRFENQAYLLKQMEEKDSRKNEEKYLQQIQAAILERDAEEYNAVEKQKVIDRKLRNLEHRKDIERQMEYKSRQSVPEMSEAEIQLNRPLLELVERTLQTRDEYAKMAKEVQKPIAEEEEDV